MSCLKNLHHAARKCSSGTFTISPQRSHKPEASAVVVPCLGVWLCIGATVTTGTGTLPLLLGALQLPPRPLQLSLSQLSQRSLQLHWGSGTLLLRLYMEVCGE